MKNPEMNERKKQIASIRWIQIVITGAAIIIALVHLIWPTLTIDSITMVLIVIAVIPWLAPLLKAIELPGGWKVEFQDVQNIKNKADEAGLLVPINDAQRTVYYFQQIADQDPNLALASLRIEIEKRLIKIAEVNNIDVPRSSVGNLLRILGEKNILTGNERGVLADLTGLLNSAVHGASVDKQTTQSAIEMGSSLLKALDEKIVDIKVEKSPLFTQLTSHMTTSSKVA